MFHGIVDRTVVHRAHPPVWPVKHNLDVTWLKWRSWHCNGMSIHAGFAMRGVYLGPKFRIVVSPTLYIGMPDTERSSEAATLA